MIHGMDEASSIANALGIILTRGFRNGLYRDVTADITEGLSEATYPVLSALSRAVEPTSAASLATEVGLDRSVVSRRAGELIDAKLVTQESHPGDRRQALLSLTPAGQQAISEARRRLDVAIAQHISNWTPTDRGLFAALLVRFTETALDVVPENRE